MKNVRTNRLLVIVVVLQALVLAGQWFNGSLISTAQAQIPDGGSQRAQTIEELKSVNAKLDRIAALLESGKLTVHTVASHDDK